MTPDTLRSMRLELEKRAAVYKGLARRAARAFTRSPMASTVATGTAGAAVGGARGAIAERQQGGSGIIGGVAGAAQGGILGAAAGGATSGLGRSYRDAKLLNPALSRSGAVGAALARGGKKVTDFGKRQVHGFTGSHRNRPGEIGLRSRATAEKKITLAELRAKDELKHVSDPKKRKKIQETLKSRASRLREVGAQGQESLEAGATSLPGLARGFRDDPKRLGKALMHETTGGSKAGTALALGAPVAMMGPSLAKGDESATGGRSLKQKLVETGTMIGGGVLTGGLPIVPMVAGGVAIDAAGQALLRKKKKRQAEVGR